MIKCDLLSSSVKKRGVACGCIGTGLVLNGKRRERCIEKDVNLFEIDGISQIGFITNVCAGQSRCQSTYLSSSRLIRLFLIHDRKMKV
jgi:hypothetical protein